MALTLNQKIEMTETLLDSIYQEAQQLLITDEQAQLLEQLQMSLELFST